MNIKNNELEICRAYSEFYKKIKDTILVKENIDLSKTDVTEAVLIRMFTYYVNQEINKIILGKGRMQSASDFFVETILYYLHKVLDDKLTIYSERTISKGFMPDISIWKDSECIAIIECKTQLGYNRSGYLEQHLQRKRLLQQIFPNANSYLLVMTNKNWGKNNGFTQQDRIECPNELFSLCRSWPSQVDTTNIVNYIQDRFEDLLMKFSFENIKQND